MTTSRFRGHDAEAGEVARCLPGSSHRDRSLHVCTGQGVGMTCARSQDVNELGRHGEVQLLLTTPRMFDRTFGITGVIAGYLYPQGQVEKAPRMPPKARLRFDDVARSVTSRRYLWSRPNAARGWGRRYALSQIVERRYRQPLFSLEVARQRSARARPSISRRAFPAFPTPGRCERPRSGRPDSAR